MYIVKCQNLTDVQMHLTPQQSKTAFRVNASQMKQTLESKGTPIKCDVVEISETGRQKLKESMASEGSCPAE